MTERLTPSGSFHPTARVSEPIHRLGILGLGVSPDHSHYTPLPDVPLVSLARPTAEYPREVALPLPRERIARHFAAWRADPSQRPAFAFQTPPTGPVVIAASLACPDLFLLDAPLGPERLNAIVALVESARSSNRRLAILTATPANANAIVLALPAAGVGRACGDSEPDLPPVVAEQTAKALALSEWHSRRSALLFRKQEVAKQRNWWKEWDRLDAMEADAVGSAENLKQLEAAHAATIETGNAAERTDAETRRTLEAQLAKGPPAAQASGGLGGFVKKLFGGVKTDPQTAAAEAKLRELDAAATARGSQIAGAEEQFRIRRTEILAEELGVFQKQRDALNATRPLTGSEQLRMTLSDLENEIADSERPPVSPHREAMNHLGVVIGPLAALDSDFFFAPTHPEAEPAFDRVLFADAEDLGESDFIRAARLANTWTMLGSLDVPRPAHRNGKPGRGEFFRDTFDAVSTAPWRVEKDRLVALLAACGSRGLRAEPLADTPAIELRFHDQPNGDTELAEVAFPPHFTLIDAKRFLFAELGAPKAQFLGLPEWSATTEHIVCSWPGEGIAFELGSGIQESLSEGFTTQFRFANAAGWTRESAQEWYGEHFGHLPATRAARLSSSR